MTDTADVLADRATFDTNPPWPRRCGYCQHEVDADHATAHWHRGFISRCRRRTEPTRAA